MPEESTSPQALTLGWLQGLDAAAVTRLLRNRPDVATPPPRSLMALDIRLHNAFSMREALHRLRALPLAVISAVAELSRTATPPTIADVSARLGIAPEHALVGAQQAYDVALLLAPQRPSSVENQVYTAASLVRLTRSLLDLPVPGQVPTDDLPECLESLDERCRRILHTLSAAHGVGSTKETGPDADPDHPVAKLIALGLLRVVEPGTVMLPRAVTQALAGHPVYEVPFTPPPWIPAEYLPGEGSVLPDNVPRSDNAPRSHAPGIADLAAQRSIDDTGIAQMLEVVRLLGELLTIVTREPLETLKNGTIGVRLTAKFSEKLGVSQLEFARLVCLGVAGGLLSRGEPHPLPKNDLGADYLGPTPQGHAWLEAPLPQRAAYLAAVAVGTDMSPWLVKDSTRILSHEMLTTTGQGTRAHVLAAYCRTVSGDALGDADAVSSMLYFRPGILSVDNVDTLVSETLDEAVWLGLLAPVRPERHEDSGELGRVLGASSILRELLTPGLLKEAELICTFPAPPTPEVPAQAPSEKLVTVCADLIPPMVDTLIAQSDFTLLAPGPLDPAMQRELATMATLESPGLASVWRISGDSVARGLAAGRTATDLLDWLNQHCMGGLPDNLRYLITDTARSQGSLRGGPAGSYLRCEDEAQLSAICALARITDLGIDRIAPTVAISMRPLIDLMQTLEEEGYHITAEGPGGASIDVRPATTIVTEDDAHAQLRSRRGRVAATSGEALEAGITHVLSLYSSSPSPTTQAKPTSPSPQEIIGQLEEAARSKRRTVLGYVDKNGDAASITGIPMRVGAGWVDLRCDGDTTVMRFALHRLTHVAQAAAD